jgi:deazaflavin-dependent oxidoreductase (nitroreductase family)
MAEAFKPGLRRRIGNGVISAALRVGLGPKNLAILTVRGRKSGKLYSTPVTPVEYDGVRYLVSPYGERPWLKNATAAGRVVLSRGRRHETVAVERVSPAQAAPVLREYLSLKIVRPYFDVTEQSTTDEIEAEAPRHPVLRVTPLPASPSGATTPT